MTHSHSNIESTENQEFNLLESLSARLLYGINRNELEITIQDLVKSYILVKGASYLSLDNNHTVDIPTQWQSAPLHRFLLAGIQLKESDLFFEWTHFLKRKSISFPVNILVPLMEWARTDLNVANFIQAFLGPVGQQLATLFPEFHILSEQHQEHPLQFSKLDQRLYAFEKFRERNPENAFNYFLQTHQELKDPEKIKWLRILHPKLSQKEWNALQILINPKKIQLHQELLYLKLSVDETAFKNQQVQFQYYLSENSLDEYYSKISPTIEHSIRLSPLRFMTTQENFHTYLKWIQEKELFPILLTALKEQAYIELATACFEFLLEQKLLTEHLALGNLSHGMDHKVFNHCCVLWIEAEQDAIDLEAFLMFIRHEKLFWSDEVLLKLVALRNSKALQRIYDFNVFWQLLPYKINPNSLQIQSIPDECKMYLNQQIHFDSVLKFRKGIRK